MTHDIRRSTQRASRPLRAWRQLTLALLIGASAACGAASKTATFRVMVELFESKSVLCGTAGTQVVTVSCTVPETQAQTQPQLRQTNLHLFRAHEWLGTVDAMMTTGTVQSWRVVRVADRDYLEIVVGW